MEKKCFLSILIVVGVLVNLTVAVGQVIPPRAHGTPSAGPTIEQAQQEDAMGPKARVAVTRFEDKTAKGRRWENIGDGMAEMLGHALFATNRFIVLERKALGDVLQEQDLGASGRVKASTAAKMGEIEGADLLIQGTITEFHPGDSGAGGGLGGLIPGTFGRVVGGVAGGIKTSHVAMVVKVIDANTGRVLASEQVEGKATDVGGLVGGGGGGLAGGLSGFSKTPMEKAIRISIEESVKLILAKTPAEYYRVQSGLKPQPTTPKSLEVKAAPAATAPQTPPPKAALSSATPSAAEPRIIYMKWPSVFVREGPGTNFKNIVEVKKGTPLELLEEKGTWLRIRLEDGQEGWIGKATASDTP